MNSVESVIESLKRDYNYIIDDDFDNEPIEIEFDRLENSRIVLSDKVKEIFKNISLTTLIDKKEIGFFAYGMEYLDNQVVLEEVIISDFNKASDIITSSNTTWLSKYSIPYAKNPISFLSIKVVKLIFLNISFTLSDNTIREFSNLSNSISIGSLSKSSSII